MIFSTKNIKPDFAFDFGRYSQTLDATFSSEWGPFTRFPERCHQCTRGS